MKTVVKLLLFLSSVVVSPLAAAERLARKLLHRDVWFETHGEILSLVPGRIGQLLRIGYYRLTLRKCEMSEIHFGSYFMHSPADLGKRVYIGTRCLIGLATIGDDALIADHVQILSGSRQHHPDQFGYVRVHIGKASWIGAGAIIMADVGENSIIGAGSIVTKPIPDNAVAVGNPARVIRFTSDGDRLTKPIPTKVRLLHGA